MKKLFLFVAVSAFAFSMTSCSSDDNGSSTGSGSVKFKVNGTQKTFNNVTVTKTTVDGEVLLSITKANGSDAIILDLYQGDTGADAVDTFAYVSNNISYTDFTADFVSNVTESTGGKAKGTFSGTLSGFSQTGESQPDAVVTEGTFDVTYKTN